jgi:hypothetical protein
MHVNSARRLAGIAGSCITMGLAASLPLQSQAQGMDEPWRFQAALYGWLPSIGGSSRFPEAGGGSSVDVSMRQVLDALKMAFMGSFSAKKGEWGVWTDLVYADFGHTKTNFRDFEINGNPLPGGVAADLTLDLKNWIWTTAGTYQFASTPDYTADLLFGVRLLDMNQTLDWSLQGNIAQVPVSRTGRVDASLTNWDAIIGVKGAASFGEGRKWFVPYYADIGTGESKLTWQVNLGIGYKFDWGALVASWRYLDYEMKSGNAIESLTMNGPLFGAVFQF